MKFISGIKHVKDSSRSLPELAEQKNYSVDSGNPPNVSMPISRINDPVIWDPEVSAFVFSSDGSIVSCQGRLNGTTGG